MRFPAFMFWPERYWFDAYDLTDAQHGIYLRLLIVQWNCPRCKIPNDDAWIAGKMGRSVEAVQTEVRPLIARFFKTDGNWVWQKKLFEEHSRLSRLSKRGSDANKARWTKEKVSSQTDPTTAVLGVGPTPTPTPTKKKDISSKPSSTISRAKEDFTHKSNGNGVGLGSHVTIADPLQRIARFQQKLAPVLGSDAWTTIGAACDRSNPNHARCLELCKQAAKMINKGWPRNWPTNLGA